jgi:hypothetical protein
VQNISDDRFATATAFNSALRQLGGVIGVAACVSYLSKEAVRHPLDAFHRVWLAATVVAVVAGVIALALARPRTSMTAVGTSPVAMEG